MRPEADDLQAHAYVDGELDLASTLRFEERLQAQPRLQAQVEALRALSHSVRAGAAYHAAPADLRARIFGATSPTPVRAAQGRGGRWRERAARAWPWQALVPSLAVAAVAAVAVNLTLVRVEDAQRQREELVASHVRATLSQRAIDVASSDQHTVKPWFATQLDFSPPVRELGMPGSTLVGGRVDYVQGRKVAVVVYRLRNHVVDHYMWPQSGSDTGVEVRELRGFKVAQWRQGGLAHRIVSDMNDAELQAVVAASR